MYLFTRNVLHAGPPAEAGAYAVEMRQFVADATGREVGLWRAVFGAPLGSMTYTMQVDGLADFAGSAPLLADPAYHARLAAGATSWAAPVVDRLLRPILGELGDMPPVGAVAAVTTATSPPVTYGGSDRLGHRHRPARRRASAACPWRSSTSELRPFGAVSWIAVAAGHGAAEAAGKAVTPTPPTSRSSPRRAACSSPARAPACSRPIA